MIKSGKPADQVALDPLALLDFADVMENLSKLKDLDIVPKQFVDYIKEDDKKITTLIEYSAALVAIMEDNLLVYFESINKYYDTCFKILSEFRLKESETVPQTMRNWITAYSGSKAGVLEKIPAASTIGFERNKHLYNISLSSLILMCFNGELNLSYHVRMDLIAMGAVRDLEKELNILCMIHRRFKKSSVAWHYRKVVFMLLLSQQIEKLKERLKAPGKAQTTKEDLDIIRLMWERESDRLDPVINKHGRSYKIWEYLIHITYYFVENLTSHMTELDGIFEATPKLKETFKAELDMLLIQGFMAQYERVRGMAQKNIHNHCIFVYLMHIMKILFGLKVDAFMDNSKFYEEFVAEHMKWIKEMRDYYTMIYGSAASQPAAKGSLMAGMEKDRMKMESLEEHRLEVEDLLEKYKMTKKQPKKN